MGALKRLFKKQSEGPFFLGLQLVIDASGNDDARRRLVAHFTAARPDDEAPARKGAFIRGAVSLLLELEPFWTYAYWDYVDDESQRAIDEYKAWDLDIRAGAVLDEAEVGIPVPDRPFASFGGAAAIRKYVAVSLLFLSAWPYGPAEITDEDLFFKRSTLRSLVENLVRLDPAGLQKDAVHILPTGVDDGFTEDDMLDSTWSHLRELRA
jgi:hypothetical protein